MVHFCDTNRDADGSGEGANQDLTLTSFVTRPDWFQSDT
jgi:hypothetical protein